MKKIFSSNKLYHAVFLVLAVAIVYTFKPGFIFSLDGPLNTPHLNYWFGYFRDLYFTHGFLLFLALPTVFYSILPAWLIQRLLFFVFPLYLMGLAGYQLVDSDKKWPRYFAGLFMVCNPMVYARMLDGQVGIIFGLALFTFFVSHLRQYGQDGQRRSLMTMAVFGALAIIASPHNIFFIGASGLVFLIVYGQTLEFKKVLKDGLILGGVILLLNSNWIVGNFIGRGEVADKTANIESSDYTAFRTLGPDHSNIYFNTAAMYGYWGENQGRFEHLRKTTEQYWAQIYLLLILLVVYGAYSTWQNQWHRKFTIMLLILFPVALVLAVGISHSISKPITVFLYDYLPFYKGMREPHKWVGIIMIIYAYLGSRGLENILNWKVCRDKVVATSIALLFCAWPILYAPKLFFAFGGQLQPVDYYEGWYEVNDFLNEDQDQYQVLFLPWHQYIRFKFSGKLFDNPVEKFFEAELIRGDNIEFLPHIYSQSNRPESKYIESFIREKSDRAQLFFFGEKLKKLNVKYVMLAREADWLDYGFLAKQADLKLIKDVKSLLVYQNMAWNQEDKVTYETEFPQKTQAFWLLIVTLVIQTGTVVAVATYFVNDNRKSQKSHS